MLRRPEVGLALQASRMPAISSGVCTLAAYSRDGLRICIASFMFSSFSMADSPSARDPGRR